LKPIERVARQVGFESFFFCQSIKNQIVKFLDRISTAYKIVMVYIVSIIYRVYGFFKEFKEFIEFIGFVD